MKNRKNGFTLIEVIVTTTLISIIGVFLVSFITPIFKINESISSEIEAMSMCDTIFNSIDNKILFLKSFSISVDDTLLTYELIDSANEKEIDGSEIGKEIFPNTDYNILVNFDIDQIDNEILIIKINISDQNNKEIVTMKRTLLAPNLGK